LRDLLSEKEIDHWIPKPMVGSLLVLDIQRRNRLVITFRNLLASLLYRDLVTSLDQFVLCIFEDNSVFIPLLDELAQGLVITIDPYSLDLWSEDFRQFVDGA